MNNSSDNVPQSIVQSMESSSGDIFSSNGDGDGGVFNSLKNINTTTWILIVLILAFLGFNIFVYLAKGTQGIADFFAPLIKMVAGITASITGQVVDVSAEGAKAVVGGTAGVIDSGLSAVQDISTAVKDISPNPNSASTIKGQPVNQTQPQVDIMQQSTLNKALNTNQSQQPQNQDYEATEASSSIGGNKSGWCYIGEERGFRTCSQVGTDDTCMSGNIFPTQEICMNPSLRA